MTFSTKRTIASILAAWVLLGCHEPQTSKLKTDPVPAPVNPFDVANEAIIPQRAAEILGLVAPTDPSATTAKCAKCHDDFRSFEGLHKLSDANYAAYNCFFADISQAEGARQAVACLAEVAYSTAIDKPSKPYSDIQIEEGIRQLKPGQIGFFSAAVNSEIFKKTFETAGFTTAYKEWKVKASMPYRGMTLSSKDFQTVLAWMMDDMPEKEKYLNHNGPQTCESGEESFIGANVRQHVQTMSEEGEGWQFVNLARGVPMFACSEGKACFTNQNEGQDIFPLIPGWLNQAGELRQLLVIPDRTSFWTRSSADGRFVAYGASPKSKIIDLLPLLQGKPVRSISVEAEFDPAFTPDNQAFLFQGEPHGSRFCNQSLLAQADLVTLDFAQVGCSSSDLNIGLYQAIGSSLNSADIVTVSGRFKSDDGQYMFQDTPPFFSSSADMEISHVRRSDSLGFEKVSVTTIPTPYTANWMLSPSQGLLMGTISARTAENRARHGGYHLVRSDASSITLGQTLPSVSTADSALLCVGSGEKPTISFDERYLVYYSYAKQTTTVSIQESSADLYVIDLLGDGQAVKLTSMPLGMYAQFPHFRSDGWLYFTVYDAKSDKRTVFATDTVLRLM